MRNPVDRLTAALADRYKIERHLGEGGMAIVYLAEDLKHKRKVAVKVLRPEIAAVLGAGHRSADLVLQGEERPVVGCVAMGDLVMEALEAAQ